MWLKACLLAFVAVATVVAQNGDKPGERQEPPPKDLAIPPSPALSATEALKTFKVPPGFTVEIVATDPLVEAPVAMQFGPDGRLWVVELRGFMPNVDGEGEDEPVGRIVVLEDTDNDGAMDKRSIFLDGLVMARALGLVRDGALVAEPPFLWFARDTDGDGKADEKNEVAADYGSQVNPEHTSNGLLWALDNWIYSANHTVRYRNVTGEWEREETVFRGQWGITQDDFGRLFYNSNSDQLRADLIPAHYLLRNPNHTAPKGANYQVAKDQTTWPGRVTPGINRGYQKGMLRDGRLAKFTAACGPVIYRGHSFPEEFQGNAFVAEPSGNFIRRNILTEQNGLITARNAYDKAEFLTSTDERFRPVNLYNGPDGNLYVVDMYRGVLQHRIYLTTYLRNQVLDRSLDAPVNFGRIYRVRPTNGKRAEAPQLSKATVPQLAAALKSPNGWTRDTAQQLLVEKRDSAAAAELKKLATSTNRATTVVHALWTLDGSGQLDEETVTSALKAQEPLVRVHALRLSERFLTNGTAALERMLELQNDPDTRVQWQLALSLGEAKTPAAEAALVAVLNRNISNEFIRDAVITGLKDRELGFLTRLVESPIWVSMSDPRKRTIEALSRAIAASRRGQAVDGLVNLAANSAAPWQKVAMLDGLLAIVPRASKGKPAPRGRPIQLAGQPEGYTSLKSNQDAAVQERFVKADDLLVWPGKPGVKPEDIVTPLTADEQKRFDAGKELYTLTCGACHQPHGRGQEGLAPPLADAEWVTGPQGRLSRIILQGVKGPISVNGRTYEMEMPPLGVLDDEQVAALMTYVRREWHHGASPVTAADVAKARKETEGREEAWTQEELNQIR